VTDPGPPVALSALDEARFGIRTAKAPAITATLLPEILDLCRRERVALLIARCAASDLPAAQALEAAGGFLTDTLVYYARDLAGPAGPAEGGGMPVRPVRPGEEGTVEAVAAAAFRGYLGHYHADPRLDRAACDAVYTSWARRSCLHREVADEVLVAERDGRIVGFATLKQHGPEEGEGILFGVAPEAQGLGVYRALMVNGMARCRAKGARRMVVSTQITNAAVQRVWTRLGFELRHAVYTFHKWFDA
jgi:ribosomal protein S18 acetylase RimI-like enzyme